MRNLLLGHRQAPTRPQRWEKRFQIPRAETGTATWSETEIAELLSLLRLGSDTPLSCVVVETLPSRS